MVDKLIIYNMSRLRTHGEIKISNRLVPKNERKTEEVRGNGTLKIPRLSTELTQPHPSINCETPRAAQKMVPVLYSPATKDESSQQEPRGGTIKVVMEPKSIKTEEGGKETIIKQFQMPKSPAIKKLEQMSSEIERVKKEQCEKDQEISSLSHQLQALKQQNSLLQHQLVRARIEHEGTLKELVASHNESLFLKEQELHRLLHKVRQLHALSSQHERKHELALQELSLSLSQNQLLTAELAQCREKLQHQEDILQKQCESQQIEKLIPRSACLNLEEIDRKLSVQSERMLQLAEVVPLIKEKLKQRQGEVEELLECTEAYKSIAKELKEKVAERGMLEECYGEILEIFDVEAEEDEGKTHEHLIMVINELTGRLNSLVKMANEDRDNIAELEEEKARLYGKLRESEKFLSKLEGENSGYRARVGELEGVSKEKQELERLVEALNSDIMRTQVSLLSMGYGLEELLSSP